MLYGANRIGGPRGSSMGGGGGGGGGTPLAYRAVDSIADGEAARDTLSLTGLDGDTDAVYFIHFLFLFDSVTWEVEMEPNGAATNLLGVIASNNAGPSQGTDWRFCASGGGATTPGWCSGTIILHSARTIRGVTVYRTFESKSGNFTNNTSAGSAGMREARGIHRNNDANLTSLDFVTTVDFEEGSYVYAENGLYTPAQVIDE